MSTSSSVPAFTARGKPSILPPLQHDAAPRATSQSTSLPVLMSDSSSVLPLPPQMVALAPNAPPQQQASNNTTLPSIAPYAYNASTLPPPSSAPPQGFAPYQSYPYHYSQYMPFLSTAPFLTPLSHPISASASPSPYPYFPAPPLQMSPFPMPLPPSAPSASAHPSAAAHHSSLLNPLPLSDNLSLQFQSRRYQLLIRAPPANPGGGAANTYGVTDRMRRNRERKERESARIESERMQNEKNYKRGKSKSKKIKPVVKESPREKEPLKEAAPVEEKSLPSPQPSNTSQSNKLRKLIILFLSASPPSHAFFSLLNRQPSFTDKQIDMLVAAGPGVLDVLKQLEHANKKYENCQDLINDVLLHVDHQVEQLHDDYDKSAPQVSLLQLHHSMDAHLTSIVPTAADRARLIEFLQHPSHHMFEQSEYVAVTEQELDELIIASGGIDHLIELLEHMESESRHFDSVTQILFAVKAALIAESENAKVKEEIYQYFKRGIELHEKELTRKKNQSKYKKKTTSATSHPQSHSHSVSHLNTSSTHNHYDHSSQHNNHQILSISPSPPPLTSCSLFLHLNNPFYVTFADVERLFDETTAGKYILVYLQQLEENQVKLNTWNELIWELIKLHCRNMEKYKSYSNPSAPITPQAKHIILRKLAMVELLHSSNGDEQKIKDEELSLLMSQVPYLHLILGYITIFQQQKLTFPTFMALLFHIKLHHLLFLHEILLYLRSTQCHIFKLPSTEHNDASATPMITMRHVERLVSEYGGGVEVMGWLRELNGLIILDSHVEASDRHMELSATTQITDATSNNTRLQPFTSVTQFLTYVSNLSKQSHVQIAESKQILFQFFQGQHKLFLEDTTLSEHDINKLYDIAGEDTLVLLSWFQDQKRQFASLPALLATLQSEAQTVSSQKYDIFLHLISNNSKLFSQVLYDDELIDGEKIKGINKENKRHGYERSMNDALAEELKQQAKAKELEKEKRKHSRTASTAFLEQALAHTASTGQSDSRTHATPSSPTAYHANPLSIVHHLNYWALPTSATSEAHAVEHTGICYLSPHQINRIYRESMAGPLTLNYLWQLEVDHAEVSSISHLITTVANAHRNHRMNLQSERFILIQELLASSNPPLFSHPIRVTEEEIEQLLAIFHNVEYTIFHINYLRFIQRQYSSFLELCADVQEEKKKSDVIMKNILVYLSHPLCFLLSSSILITPDIVRRLYYETKTGYDLPYYLQIIDGRSNGKISDMEEKRRMKQYEYYQELLKSTQSHSLLPTPVASQDVPIEPIVKKFSNVTDLLLAIKAMKTDMDAQEDKTVEFMNSSRCLFYHVAANKYESQVKVEEIKEVEPSNSKVYTVGVNSQALVPVNNDSALVPANDGSALATSNATSQANSAPLWSRFEVHRLFIESESGLDCYNHLQYINQQFLNHSEQQISNHTVEPLVLFSNLDSLISHIHSLHLQLVQQRNIDKSILYSFLSQSPAQNSLMSIGFHANNHMKYGNLNPDYQQHTYYNQEIIALNQHIKQQGIHDEADELSFLTASFSPSISAAYNSTLRLHWHSNDIDRIYQVGQALNVGPATLLMLQEMETESKNTGKQHHSVEEIIKGIEAMKEKIKTRKHDLYAFLLQYAPRFFGKVQAAPAPPAASKQSASLSKVMVPTKSSNSKAVARTKPPSVTPTTAPSAVSFFIPSPSDVSVFYEHCGANQFTLDILRDVELDVVGLKSFDSMEELTEFVNQEYVKRIEKQRNKEKEVIEFLSNPACPLFKHPLQLSKPAIHYLIGQAGGNAEMTLFYIQHLLNSHEVFDNFIDLLKVIKQFFIHQQEQEALIFNYLTIGDGAQLFSTCSHIGTIHLSSVTRLYIEGQCGKNTFHCLQNYVLNKRTFSNGFKELILAMKEEKITEKEEMNEDKQIVYKYLRREPGSEINGALCDLFHIYYQDDLKQHEYPYDYNQSDIAHTASMAMPNSTVTINTAILTNTISATITHSDIDQLYYQSNAGRYMLKYLNQFNEQLLNFPSFQQLIQYTTTHHNRLEDLRSRIYSFFYPAGHTSNNPHLFEASPFTIEITMPQIDRIMEESGCEEETLSYLYGLEMQHISIQTIEELISRLQAARQLYITDLSSHCQLILQYLSSPSCTLFREPLQITDHHLSLLVKAGRESIVTGQQQGLDTITLPSAGAISAGTFPTNKFSPSTAILQCLIYLNTMKHWYNSAKALVLAVRKLLKELVNVKREVFAYLNSSDCELWDSPIDLSISPVDPSSPTIMSSPSSSLLNGRTGKVRSNLSNTATINQLPLRVNSDQLYLLFEDVGSCVEIKNDLMKFQEKKLRFTTLDQLKVALKQFHLARLSQRLGLLNWFQSVDCTLFSKCKSGYVFLLTLQDMKQLLDLLESDEEKEEEEWREEQMRRQAGINQSKHGLLSEEDTPNSYEYNKITNDSVNIAAQQHQLPYPYELRVLRILRELSEIGKKMASIEELFYVVKQCNFELYQREEMILNFLNSPSCRCIQPIHSSLHTTSSPNSPIFSKFHVRQLLHELIDQARQQCHVSKPVQSATFNPRVEQAPTLKYTGLGDCLLVIWNINASGRVFMDFNDWLQAIKTEYLIIYEFIQEFALQTHNFQRGDPNPALSPDSSLPSQHLVLSSATASSSAPGAAQMPDMLVTLPNYIDALFLNQVKYDGQPRKSFQWEQIELEQIFTTSFLAPSLLVQQLKYKYLEYQNQKQALFHFFQRQDNPLFSYPLSTDASEMVAMFQSEEGINRLFYQSKTNIYTLHYLHLLVDANRKFDKFTDLCHTLTQMHRKRILMTKYQTIIDRYEYASLKRKHVELSEVDRKRLLDYFDSESCTIFRPTVSKPAIPGQPEDGAENGLPVFLPPKPHKGVAILPADLQNMYQTCDYDLSLLLMYCGYLSLFQKTFDSVATFMPVLNQLHQQHIEMCKSTLKWFYQSDCLVLYISKKTTSSSASTALQVYNSGSPDLVDSLNQDLYDELELDEIGLNGLGGGGSSTQDLNLQDMSNLIATATKGLSVLPHLQNFDGKRRRFASFQLLMQACKDAQQQYEDEQSKAKQLQTYIQGIYDFLSSKWCGFFNETIHSAPLSPSDQQIKQMLIHTDQSPTELLLHLHIFNQQGKKFKDYPELTESVRQAHIEALARKEEIFRWVRSRDNQLFSHSTTVTITSDSNQPFEWSYSYVQQLYELTDAGPDTLTHLTTLNTQGKKYYSFDKLLQAVTIEHEQLKLQRLTAIAAFRKKEGKSLVRAYLLDPSTHLFAVPIQIQDQQIEQLYTMGEEGETQVGIRLLGRRTRPGASTVHCLQALEKMHQAPELQYQSYSDLLRDLEGAVLNLIIERSTSLGIGEVTHPPPPQAASLPPAKPTVATSLVGPAHPQSPFTSPGAVPEFLLTVQDKQIILDYLSSPNCGLFRQISVSPLRSTLAVKTSDLTQMAKAGGDGHRTVELLKRLDAQAKQFSSFPELVLAVQVEALQRPPPPTLNNQQVLELLAFLSKSYCLLDRVDLSHKISKPELIQLLNVSGNSIDLMMMNLRDLNDNQSSLLPCVTFQELVEKAEKNFIQLQRKKREIHAYLTNPSIGLLPVDSPIAPLLLSDLNQLYIESGAGINTLHYLRTFQANQQQFQTLKELTLAVKSAHITTKNIKSMEEESEKQHLLEYFAVDCSLFHTSSNSSSVEPPTITVSDVGLRELLKLGGNGNGAIQMLKRLEEKGIKCNSFDEVLYRVRQLWRGNK